MHTNHRRKNKFRSKSHGHGRIAHMLAYSLRWWRKQAHRDRRADERRRIDHADYDALPRRYPRTIYWDYW